MGLAHPVSLPLETAKWPAHDAMHLKENSHTTHEVPRPGLGKFDKFCEGCLKVEHCVWAACRQTTSFSTNRTWCLRSSGLQARAGHLIVCRSLPCQGPLQAVQHGSLLIVVVASQFVLQVWRLDHQPAAQPGRLV